MARSRSRWVFVLSAVAAAAARPSWSWAQDETTGADPALVLEDVEAEPPSAPPDRPALRRRIAGLVESRRALGVAVVVVEPGGATFTEGFGRATDQGAAMEATTLFRVGSLTKSFLALA